MQLVTPDVQPHDPRRTMRQQAMGKAARGLPHIETLQALDQQSQLLQRAFQLEAAARDVTRLGLIQQADLRHGRNVVTVLGHLTPRRSGTQAPFDA